MQYGSNCILGIMEVGVFCSKYHPKPALNFLTTVWQHKNGKGYGLDFFTARHRFVLSYKYKQKLGILSLIWDQRTKK